MADQIPATPLYHYTSQEGLLGMLKTKKLWMTNILYLNDSSEYTHALDMVKSELENRIKNLPPVDGVWSALGEDEKKHVVYSELLTLYGSTYLIQLTQVYVFSLSMEGDDLGQWRGYCPKEGGFCVEFETGAIERVIKNGKLVPCVYLPKEKNQIIEKNFTDAEAYFKPANQLFTVCKKQMKEDDHKIIEALHNVKLAEIFASLKHESFKNEKEYRIIRSGPKVKPEDKRYRKGNSMLIPYVEEEILNSEGKLPISKIIVGPTPHPALSKLAVENFLESNGYQNIKVQISEIPYRAW